MGKWEMGKWGNGELWLWFLTHRWYSILTELKGQVWHWRLFIEMNESLIDRPFSFDLGISEKDKLFLDVSFNSLGLNSQNIEPNSLGQRSALAYSHDVSFSESGESWGHMHWNVGVSLFKSIVLFNIVQVISPDHSSPLHLGWNHHAPIFIINFILNKLGKDI